MDVQLYIVYIYVNNLDEEGKNISKLNFYCILLGNVVFVIDTCVINVHLFYKFYEMTLPQQVESAQSQEFLSLEPKRSLMFDSSVRDKSDSSTVLWKKAIILCF